MLQASFVSFSPSLRLLSRPPGVNVQGPFFYLPLLEQPYWYVMEIIEDIERNHTPDKLRHTPSGLLLVPQPSNDAADPLNWPLRKKVGILGLVSVCTWIGIAQTLANQSGFFAQAKVYHKAAEEISYSVSS